MLSDHDVERNVRLIKIQAPAAAKHARELEEEIFRLRSWERGVRAALREIFNSEELWWRTSDGECAFCLGSEIDEGAFEDVEHQDSCPARRLYRFHRA